LRKTTKPSIPPKVVNVLESAFFVTMKRKRNRLVNPFVVEVRAPRAKERRASTRDEGEAALRSAPGTDVEALWALLLTSGLRLGEALALEWRDIDFRKGAVSVRQSLSEVGGICEVRETKTTGSRVALEVWALEVGRSKSGFLRSPPSRPGIPGAQPDSFSRRRPGGYPRRSNLRQRDFAPICKGAGMAG
jgi:integrase